MAVLSNPHDRRIENDRPTATAPPAGTVFATDVVVWVTTADCQKRRPGSAAMFWSQYVMRFKIVTATRDASSSQVSSTSVARTFEWSAIFGIANTKIATTMTIEKAAWRMRLVGELRRRAGASV